MTITTPVPALRADIQVHISQHEGNEVLIIHDPDGIADQDIMLEADLLNILQMLDGTRTVGEIVKELTESLNAQIDVAQLAMFIRALDDACLLESENLRQVRDYLESDVREPVCLGHSYPADADELRTFIDDIMKSSVADAYPTNAKAIVVPHIDLRVGPSTYAPPFHAIRDTDFDLVVHIGTSHYGWQDRFILTNKHFTSPLGTLKTDVALVDKLRAELPFELTRNDIAHQPEHSLELHHVFLQHLFANREFTVLPILVTSFHDLVSKQRNPERDDKVKTFCETLKRVIDESGRKAVYIVSGDLAHIGKRFGDQWNAEEFLDTLRQEDYEVMDAMVRGKSYEYFTAIANNHDRRRICGLPPVYTMLQTLNPGKGIALAYEQWNDSPTGSAVSYGSAAWFD
ncbi:MAG: AmmeMemoRadiSam system protein B [Bacteriodetes bacterium]|nr:AmmeMemoRadiSam system protein B [Bacteroidota bacterium]